MNEHEAKRVSTCAARISQAAIEAKMIEIDNAEPTGPKRIQ